MSLFDIGLFDIFWRVFFGFMVFFLLDCKFLKDGDHLQFIVSNQCPVQGIGHGRPQKYFPILPEKNQYVFNGQLVCKGVRAWKGQNMI